MKKFAGDIILLMCTKNHNHMMYGSWDTEWDRQNFMSIWAIFCPPPPVLPPTPLLPPLLMILNIKILKKKWKKCLEILSFYIYMWRSYEDHMIYGSWNIRCDRRKFLTFWTIFFPFQPFDKLENQNFNIERNTWRYYRFTRLHHMMYGC